MAMPGSILWIVAVIAERIDSSVRELRSSRKKEVSGS
jgi:hypothetical protein